MKRNKIFIFSLLLSCTFALTGCSGKTTAEVQNAPTVLAEYHPETGSSITIPVLTGDQFEYIVSDENAPTLIPTQELGLSGGSFDFEDILEHSGKPYCIVNDDVPFYTDGEIVENSYLDYGELDSLGRCTVADTCLGVDTVISPGTDRGEIGMVKPSGWVNAKYDCVEGKYLYNRCHLAAWSLTGTLADERNLITGTRYMNLSMLYGTEYEVLNYIRDIGNHVMYRVTPVFVDDELVCRGVLIECMSVEDNGAGILSCRFYYNVQPGIEIDYKTGTSEYNGIFLDTVSPGVNVESTEKTVNEDQITYILNTNSKKFHLPTCENAKKIDEKNKHSVNSERSELVEQGCEPAGCYDP